MDILAWCALAIVVPAAAAIAVPRRGLGGAGTVLVSTCLAAGARFMLGPKIFTCGGGICLDDAVVAIALGIGAALASAICAGRWVWFRKGRGA